ncbi:DUF1615 family protein [Acinetobacter baumannii]
MNPITTLGSMQVHINYAKANKRSSMNTAALRDDLYTEYGGLYYGIHRLMVYPADYDKAIYRFADYNSGMYCTLVVMQLFKNAKRTHRQGYKS